MKYLDLEKLANALDRMEHQVEISGEIRRRAYGALQNMLSIMP